jgi:hypothetical protein
MISIQHNSTINSKQDNPTINRRRRRQSNNQQNEEKPAAPNYGWHAISWAVATAIAAAIPHQLK